MANYYDRQVAESEYSPEPEVESDNEIYGGEQWDNAPLPYRDEGIAEEEGNDVIMTLNDAMYSNNATYILSRLVR